MDEKGNKMQAEMDETLAGLSDKLGKLEQRVSGTVTTVKESVESVRDTLDLRRRVRRKPWTLMAGATAIGLVGGYFSGGRRATPLRQRAALTSVPPPVPTAPSHFTGNGNYSEARAPVAPPTPVAPTKSPPGWFANLGEKYEPEIAELRGLIIGTLLGIAREVIVTQVMKPGKHPDEASADDQDTQQQ